MCCVLVVDDEPTMRDLLAMVLEDEGYTVRRAADGRDALAKIADHTPAVVVLDLQMPVLDGWGFLRLRQDNAALATLPVIVMSATHHAAATLGGLDVQRFL